MTIDQLKDDLRLARKLKVMQEVEIDQLREQWEEAVKERDKTEAHILVLVEQLGRLQDGGQVVTA
jgi:uncharacterized coiled-coil protein SlyX